MMVPYIIRTRNPSPSETASELGLSKARVKQVDEIVDRILGRRDGQLRFATKKAAKKKR